MGGRAGDPLAWTGVILPEKTLPQYKGVREDAKHVLKLIVLPKETYKSPNSKPQPLSNKDSSESLLDELLLSSSPVLLCQSSPCSSLVMLWAWLGLKALAWAWPELTKPRPRP